MIGSNVRTTRSRIIYPAVVLTWALVSHAVHANPEVKEHEIARFLMLKTSCVTLHLKRLNEGRHPPRFHAQCKNVSNWPDGIEIECAEYDDDRSCRVKTQERDFKQLDLLRRHN